MPTSSLVTAVTLDDKLSNTLILNEDLNAPLMSPYQGLIQSVPGGMDKTLGECSLG